MHFQLALKQCSNVLVNHLEEFYEMNGDKVIFANVLLFSKSLYDI